MNTLRIFSNEQLYDNNRMDIFRGDILLFPINVFANWGNFKTFGDWWILGYSDKGHIISYSRKTINNWKEL